MTSSPWISTVPASANSRPPMIRSSVDLPEPLGPSSAVSDPSGTSSETSSRATKSPKRLVTFETVIMRLPPPFEQGHQDQGQQREAHQHGRRRVGAEGVVVVDVAGVHEQRERLGLAGHAAGDDGQRAELAQRAGHRQHDAVADADADRRERDAPERLPARWRRASTAASSCSVPISCSTGSTSRTTNGSVTNMVASTMPGSEKITGQRAAEPAVVAPEQDQGDADDHRGDRERQVDDGLQHALAAEVARGPAPAP